jgi:exportin-7
MKSLSSNWSNFTVAQRIDIRNYILNYLYSRASSLSTYVTTSLLQLLARITKFAWFDDTVHQDIIDSVSKFLEQNSMVHYNIGLRILNELINEMNQTTGGHLTLTQHRKLAISFRDKVLLRIFQIALASLRRLLGSTSPVDAQQDKLKEQALKLAVQCLSFDFIGTTPDESSEDLGIVQIPSSWRSIFEDPTTLNLFLEIYRTSNPPQSTQAMDCLVQLASVRRSLFANEDDRAKYLTMLIHGIRDVLRNRTGLNEPTNHHAFCRLLARLKSNYQLNQLVAVDCYAEWISLVANLL